jgi:hypothetical protein
MKTNRGYEGWAAYKGAEEELNGVFKTERLTPR